MNNAYDTWIKNIEKAVGLPIDEMRRMTPHEYRSYLEKKNKKPITFTQRKLEIITSEELDKAIDKDLDKFL
jgi:Tfp pilus assembly protein PilP